MTDHELIIEVAKLDGWSEPFEFKPPLYADEPDRLFGVAPGWDNKSLSNILRKDLTGLEEARHIVPDYLHSRDAIIPVIEKHLRKGNYNHFDTVNAFRHEFGDPCTWQDIICASPRQLSVALLKATGKWKE